MGREFESPQAYHVFKRLARGHRISEYKFVQLLSSGIQERLHNLLHCFALVRRNRLGVDVHGGLDVCVPEQLFLCRQAGSGLVQE